MLKGDCELIDLRSDEQLILDGENFSYEDGGEYGIPYLFIHFENEDEKLPRVHAYFDPDVGTVNIHVPQGYELGSCTLSFQGQ